MPLRPDLEEGRSKIATARYLTEASRYRLLRADVRHMHYREVETEPCQVVRNMGLGVIVLDWMRALQSSSPISMR
ncbi:MAG TPA: hypothetical protein VHG08_15495 [Longimicrobium sp.]|nr:hypothetical protein [Longimicrobium sp.]